METGNAIQLGTVMSKQFARAFPSEFKRQWKEALEFKPDLITSCTLTYLQVRCPGAGKDPSGKQRWFFPLLTLALGVSNRTGSAGAVYIGRCGNVLISSDK